MLGTASLVAFIATANAMKARAFYEDVLGLYLVEDTPYALVFDSNGTRLRIQKSENASPQPYTALGWSVRELHSVALQLQERGVSFVRFDGLQQDELGVWRTPDKSKVAWFRDPDANLLSITEHAKR